MKKQNVNIFKIAQVTKNRRLQNKVSMLGRLNMYKTENLYIRLKTVIA